MSKRTKTTEIIVHHTSLSGSTPESVRQTHIAEFGWQEVGYHWIIDKQGKLHQGREEDLVGAHCQGKNSTSIGVCVLGDYQSEMPSEAAVRALVKLTKELCARYPDIKQASLHATYSSWKKCPGENLYGVVWAIDASL